MWLSAEAAVRSQVAAAPGLFVVLDVGVRHQAPFTRAGNPLEMHIPAACGALLGCLWGRVEDYSAVWAAILHGNPFLWLLHERWYSLYTVVGRHCVVAARPLGR